MRALWIAPDGSCFMTHSEDPLVEGDEVLRLEQDVIAPLASARRLFVYETQGFWRQIKTAGCVLSLCLLRPGSENA